MNNKKAVIGKIVLPFLIVLVAMSALTSCTGTIESVKNKKGEGVKRVYSYSYSTTWDATLKGIKELGVFIQNDNVDNGTICGKIDRSPASGVFIGLYISKISDKSTEVEVVTKREDPGNMFVGDWTEDIFKAIEANLKK